MRGEADNALRFMRAAADLEDKSEKHIVTPGRLVPARELLGDEAGVRVMLPGGILRRGERSLVGDIAVESLGQFRFDTVVVGVGGREVHLGGGLVGCAGERGEAEEGGEGRGDQVLFHVGFVLG